MKKITEMSDAEIIILTNEELETLIKLDMAHEGIKLIEKPKEPEYISIPEKDKTVFTIGGTDLMFEDRQHAQTISDTLLAIRDASFKSSYNSDYNLRYVKKTKLDRYDYDKIGTISAESYYQRETVDNIEENVKANNKLKKQYENEFADYQEAYDSAKNIREDIYNAYEVACAKQRNMFLMKSKFSDYLKLANQDQEIAMNFLKKAYTIDSEIETFILAQ